MNIYMNAMQMKNIEGAYAYACERVECVHNNKAVILAKFFLCAITSFLVDHHLLSSSTGDSDRRHFRRIRGNLFGKYVVRTSHKF